MKTSYSSASDSSSSSSKPRIEYEVFLSFRGEDTRKKFISHLYKALCDKGIHTFKDNLLPRGQPISSELLKAIERSQCSVIVLSENYASSSWCLDELVKILECMRDYKQIVLPIFYLVDPSDVRKQKGTIGEAFKRHESSYSTEKVQSWRDAFTQVAKLSEDALHDGTEKIQSWRDALTEVANLSGDPLHDGDEAQFIQMFIQEVSRQLKKSEEDFDISEDLFGMDSRLKKLNNFVCTSSSNDVRFIGICEMGGIGKTTLARTYHEWKSSKFDSSSFLANIREVCEKKEDGLVHLQNDLLSDTLNGFPKEIRDVDDGKRIIRKRLCQKKVLIILDDVSELDQLEALAGKANWFGSGSRILITTRDESLLTSTYKECEIYRPEHLNYNEGLQLFSWKAFKSIHPPENYTELSKQVMEYAKGLALALKVLGSFLCHKNIKEWKDALQRLKKYPEKKITKVLQITFDALSEAEQSIFLDIACFFNGFDRNRVIEIMDICGLYPTIGIKILVDKSLLQDDPTHERLRMHDLLQEMGMEIVREKYRDQPGRWSRLWKCEDLYQVLNNNTGTEEVEAIVCRYGKSKFRFEALSNMKKLRLLNISSPYGNCPLPFGDSPPANLSNELRILRWDLFPFTSFPSSFQPNQLVVLSLRRSQIKQLWNNTIKPLYNLKFIDLSFSENISELEDFKVVPNLEKLILKGCPKLVKIDQSIKSLTRLTLLDLTDCHHPESLPTSITGLKSLKTLRLGSNNMRPYLRRDVLRDRDRAMLSTIVGGDFNSLRTLDLTLARLGDGVFPEDFGCLASLEELNLSSNKFSSLPSSLNQLSKLRILDLRLCESLKSVGPDLPPSLELVNVDKCTSLETFLDPSNDQCNLNCSATCRECFNMVKRQGSKRTAFALLKRYLQNPPNPSRGLDILLPGNEIPPWFTNRSSGTSISIQLDPNWCNSKWRGLALSLCIFETDWIGNCWCDVKIDGRDWGHGLLKSPFRGGPRGHHLWLSYLPSDIYFRTEWQNTCSRIEFSFKSYYSDFQTKRIELFGECGARLIYEKDIEDLNRTANEWIE
ncbi:disease resistance protein RUN1-like isoform X2 [Ziziphus jujuba]|uniref:ADP-ribosyl cyclase/cyclic ADP-ribose hydrolase n=1 Tax=Ziziphus jujuba TaxID=326968 RepID=A0ABM4A617_ZIZJJ|nr:disease resistance protein RUN1-like isoform X2 [Ziziphus jujuba]